MKVMFATDIGRDVVRAHAFSGLLPPDPFLPDAPERVPLKAGQHGVDIVNREARGAGLE